MDHSELLTSREFAVMRSFALGRSWKQIMAKFGISRNTVQAHRTNALAKYGGGSFVGVLRDIGWLKVPGPRQP